MLETVNVHPHELRDTGRQSSYCARLIIIGTWQQRIPLPTERVEQAYRDAIYRRASRCKQQSDT
jgi:hypothetical protein